MMRLSVFFVSFVLCAASAAEAQIGVSRIEIFDAGIYKLSGEKAEDAPNTATGFIRSATNAKLIESTTCVPAERGTNFGFRFRVFGDPVGVPINLRMVTRYPPAGLRNPSTNKVHNRSEIIFPGTTSSVPLYRGYALDEDWEAVPGTWVFEIWYGERLLASQKFEVGGRCFQGASKQDKYPWRAYG